MINKKLLVICAYSLSYSFSTIASQDIIIEELSEGISYKIHCNTKNSGDKFIEALPSFDAIGTRSKEDIKDQEWKIESANQNLYFIVCNTKDRGDRYLEAYPNYGKIGLSAKSKDNQDQKWSIKRNNDETYNISCDTKSGGNRSLEAFPNSDLGESSIKLTPYSKDNQDQKWKFTTSDYKLFVTLQNFKYEKDVNNIKPVTKRAFSYHQEHSNDGDVETTYSTEYTKATTKTFSWGLKESINFTSKAKFEAGLPLVGKSDIELSLALSVEGNQQWTNSDTTTIKVASSYKVPARQSIRIEYFVDSATDLDTPFEATAFISGTRKINTKDHLNADTIKSILKGYNFKGTILTAAGNTVTAKITGVLRSDTVLSNVTKITYF